MSVTQKVITITAVVLGTAVTRFLPFIIFPSNQTPPRFIRYLGTVLPYAVMGLLVVYSLRNTSLLTGNHGLAELISIVCIILLHLWKRNMLLSIAAGTLTYMFIVQMP